MVQTKLNLTIETEKEGKQFEITNQTLCIDRVSVMTGNRRALSLSFEHSSFDGVCLDFKTDFKLLRV